MAAEGAHWGYEGHGGPAAWGDLDPANKVCAIGSQQSPIDIETTIKSQLPALKIDWAERRYHRQQAGHTIQLKFRRGAVR
jgi:carbonic anhydrase